jgi:hypothetical protein
MTNTIAGQLSLIALKCQQKCHTHTLCMPACIHTRLHIDFLPSPSSLELSSTCGQWVYSAEIRRAWPPSRVACLRLNERAARDACTHSCMHACMHAVAVKQDLTNERTLATSRTNAITCSHQTHARSQQVVADQLCWTTVGGVSRSTCCGGRRAPRKNAQGACVSGAFTRAPLYFSARTSPPSLSSSSSSLSLSFSSYPPMPHMSIGNSEHLALTATLVARVAHTPMIGQTVCSLILRLSLPPLSLSSLRCLTMSRILSGSLLVTSLSYLVTVRRALLARCRRVFDPRTASWPTASTSTRSARMPQMVRVHPPTNDLSTCQVMSSGSSK